VSGEVVYARPAPPQTAPRRRRDGGGVPAAAEALRELRFKFGLGSNAVPGSTSWWIWVFPGLALVLILVCVNLVGDALDAALNPTAARG
jgi:hypothetical protein